MHRPLAPLALAAALLAAPGPAAAHPHVFIDASADFGFDEAGRLATLRVTWRYDAFYSLLILEAVEIDQDADGLLTPEDVEKLIEAFSVWEAGWHGDAFLEVGGAPAALSDPVEMTGTMQDGRIEMTFLREVSPAPEAAGLAATLRIYDPTYFIAYDVVGDPGFENGPEGCRAAVAAPVRSSDLARLEASLAELPPDATPDQPDVGAFFADRIELRCPASSR